MRWLALMLIAGLVAGCDEERPTFVLTGGDAERGRFAIRQRGCGSCHDIPGVPGANGLVGPSLKNLRARLYIAGQRTHTVENLIAFIRDPHAVEPGTAMPNTGVTADEARDIAAYLYTIR